MLAARRTGQGTQQAEKEEERVRKKKKKQQLGELENRLLCGHRAGGTHRKKQKGGGKGRGGHVTSLRTKNPIKEKRAATATLMPQRSGGAKIKKGDYVGEK